MIEIIVNEQPLLVADKTNCTQLIKQLSYENVRIALELNNEIVSKSKHLTTFLAQGDKVEIVKAVGGG